MPNNWGGSRPNAGRKPAAQTVNRRDLLQQALTPDDWIALFKHLHQVALSSDPHAVRAAGLLLQYQFSPLTEPADETEPEPIRLIEVIRSAPRPDAPATDPQCGPAPDSLYYEVVPCSPLHAPPPPDAPTPDGEDEDDEGDEDAAASNPPPVRTAATRPAVPPPTPAPRRAAKPARPAASLHSAVSTRPAPSSAAAFSDPPTRHPTTRAERQARRRALRRKATVSRHRAAIRERHARALAKL